jgi:hypothetical protein
MLILCFRQIHIECFQKKNNCLECSIDVENIEIPTIAQDSFVEAETPITIETPFVEAVTVETPVVVDEAVVATETPASTETPVAVVETVVEAVTVETPVVVDSLATVEATVDVQEAAIEAETPVPVETPAVEAVTVEPPVAVDEAVVEADEPVSAEAPVVEAEEPFHHSPGHIEPLLKTACKPLDHFIIGEAFLCYCVGTLPEHRSPDTADGRVAYGYVTCILDSPFRSLEPRHLMFSFNFVFINLVLLAQDFLLR